MSMKQVEGKGGKSMQRCIWGLILIMMYGGINAGAMAENRSKAYKCANSGRTMGMSEPRPGTLKGRIDNMEVDVSVTEAGPDQTAYIRIGVTKKELIRIGVMKKELMAEITVSSSDEALEHACAVIESYYNSLKEPPPPSAKELRRDVTEFYAQLELR